ncbi:PTS system mannose/fructose/N-acetylgalactosamine-transporter subunit IIB [Bacillus niameyensis]|uniref:PTS system mannose/fructose/N-acetylgalactosamine-transporter subunit IIB n=1 Tax=Bacillus niameyensis TaxID=1522308 RepID=UPI0007810E95|nr:PTS sugar transporter subunit IIB [Bacillus niameyensis]
MKISLVRVDDRLIHGQVAVGWTKSVGATHIVVACDEVANDPVQVTLLKFAAPSGVKASILTVEDAARKLSNQEFKNDKILLLVRDPISLIRLLNEGVDFTEVNIGNVRSMEGRKRIIKEVAATKEEIAHWKELDQRNIKLRARWLPGARETNFNDLIKKY